MGQKERVRDEVRDGSADYGSELIGKKDTLHNTCAAGTLETNDYADTS